MINQENDKHNNTSNCLLCNTNIADKENSHIVPKFISKSLLGDTNNKQGFMIGNNSKKPIKQTQDTPKESFILCENCELYFSVLETYTAEKLNKRIRDARYDYQFENKIIENKILTRKCLEIDIIVFRLFLYSIIWRCNVTKSKVFENFKLTKIENEYLNEILIHYKQPTQKKLLEKIELFSSKMKYFPFTLFTAQSFKNKTSNILFFHTFHDHTYQFFLNEYMIHFSFHENGLIQQPLEITNSKKENLILTVLSESDWHDMMKNHWEWFANQIK